jgi:mono/diheme cytochrome c family protein
MKQAMGKIIVLLVAGLAFGSANSSVDKEISGKSVFKNNCAACHGNNGIGIVSDWKKRLPDGSFPPPPLNGTAHSWHHSPKQLMSVINGGGVMYGGKMPGFKRILKEEEKDAVLKYIQSLWPQNIQERYNRNFKNQRK